MSKCYFNRQTLQNFLDICEICSDIIIWCPANCTVYDLYELPEDFLTWYVKSLALNGPSLQIEIVEDFN